MKELLHEEKRETVVAHLMTKVVGIKELEKNRPGAIGNDSMLQNRSWNNLDVHLSAQPWLNVQIVTNRGVW